jgi:AcrR family transcriptional regulator
MNSGDGATLAARGAGKSVLRRLKPGPGLSRKEVAIDQKFRLRVALSGLVAESGYDAVTVRALIRRANISTSTFYNHYRSVEDCLGNIVKSTIRSVVEDLARVDRANPIEGLRSSLRQLLTTMAEEPDVAQAVFIEAYSAGPLVQNEMDAAFRDFERVLAETLEAAPRPATGTTHLAVGLVAGFTGIIRQTAIAGRVEELPDLADELTDWMLSVAHEEVVTFCVSRARPVDGMVGDRVPEAGVLSMSRGSVADASQRAIMTTARLAASGGLAGLTSAKIRKDAGLSRREFERYFACVEECFLDAVESISIMAADTACGSAAGSLSWEQWVCKAMATLCRIASGDRDLSRLVLLDITAPGRIGLLRREELIDRAAIFIHHQAPAEQRPTEVRAIASISAIWRIAETEVAARRTTELPSLAPVFAYVILWAPRFEDRPKQAPAHGSVDELPLSVA